MDVVALWRYPVKSLQGEALDHSEVTTTGLAGDRSWALEDCTTGLVLTARRAPELLYATGVLDGDRAVVRLPDGTETDDDGVLSRWLARDVALVAADPGRTGTYEIATSIDEAPDAEWITWSGPAGSFHDSTRTQVSIIGAASLGSWAVRRFRPNVVVAGDGEHALVGATVANGRGLALDVVKHTDRCVIVSRPQPGGIERDLEVLRTVLRERDGHLGVGALVARPGRLVVGDVLTVDGGAVAPSP